MQLPVATYTVTDTIQTNAGTLEPGDFIVVREQENGRRRITFTRHADYAEDALVAAVLAGAASAVRRWPTGDVADA